MGLDTSALARVLGLSGTTWKEYRDQGVTERVADRLAVKAGFHASEIWPEIVDDWIAASSLECADPNCAKPFLPTNRRQRFCCPSCRSNYHKRNKYATDPEFRQMLKDRARQAYRESAGYYRKQQARRYWSNPEMQRERAAIYRAQAKQTAA